MPQHALPVPEAPMVREKHEPAPVPHPTGKPATQPPAARYTPSWIPGPTSEPRDKRLKDLAELLNVLVTLNENSRDEFRGHSASVAKLSKMMTERMGLDENAQLHAMIAANLHDLGKPISYHLTALNVAQYDTHKRAALKLAYTPQRLVESVGLPMEATSAVSAMYERFDGTGFPGRISGKSIPLAARVLALCDTYSDLTLNPRNFFRKELSHEEAQEVLAEHAGKLFDPDLVELLTQLVVGEDLRRKLSDDNPLVLIVEPDAEEATILELRLVAQGFDVKVTRAADQALKVAESGEVRFVLSEVDLQPFDGFDLLQRLRRAENTKGVPFLFVAKNSDAGAVDRAFSLGAQDYVVKPTTGDVLAGKLRRLLTAPRKNSSDAVATGVAGSLRDLALPDLMQILFHGRKSGKVSVKSSGREGQLHFQEGRMVHALLDELAGEEAVYEMLAFADGSFALDPTFEATTTTIQATPEMVILEGLRRLDEKNRDA
jgi:response regulator RpfG family c-di-GMP phosphodiesterase